VLRSYWGEGQRDRHKIRKAHDAARTDDMIWVHWAKSVPTQENCSRPVIYSNLEMIKIIELQLADKAK
jgi:hypothetical protein